MVVLIVIVAVVVLLALGLWAAFNGLVKRRTRTQEAWSEIDVELKRRHDLIPNLVSTVEGYATHERGTFEAVTTARANALPPAQPATPAESRQLRMRSPARCAHCSPSPKTIPSFARWRAFSSCRRRSQRQRTRSNMPVATTTQAPATTTSRCRRSRAI